MGSRLVLVLISENSSGFDSAHLALLPVACPRGHPLATAGAQLEVQRRGEEGGRFRTTVSHSIPRHTRSRITPRESYRRPPEFGPDALSRVAPAQVNCPIAEPPPHRGGELQPSVRRSGAKRTPFRKKRPIPVVPRCYRTGSNYRNGRPPEESTRSPRRTPPGGF